LPFPQVAAQAWVAPVPLVPRQIGSTVQVFEQPVPSPLKRPFGPVQPVGSFAGSAPQSHASPVSTTPLPHTPFVQTLGDPLQLAPGSIWQVDEQPSPLTSLPSSHCLPNSTFPSPQVGVQGFPATRQLQPGSSLQVEEQPSPPFVFPSSHSLFEVNTPFPQTPRYWHGCPGFGQVQSASIWHSELHPSPLVVLPSSHPSPKSFELLPQFFGSPTVTIALPPPPPTLQSTPQLPLLPP
jgi:hypothetical protein